MDFGTIIGVFSGLLLILISLLLGEGGLGSFVNMPGVLIVFGGTLAAILIMFPMASVLATFKIAMNAFTIKLASPKIIVDYFYTVALKVRKSSILSLQNEKFPDNFMKKGIFMAIDGSKPDEIKKLLQSEVTSLETRHTIGQDVFEQMGALAPAFGMIGTLVGLVQMLQNLSDPSAIGPAMAVSLLTTFYGAVGANLIFLPIAKKLELRSQEEIDLRNIIIEGIISLQSGDNPMVLKDKLEVYLHPSQRNTSTKNKSASATAPQGAPKTAKATK